MLTGSKRKNSFKLIYTFLLMMFIGSNVTGIQAAESIPDTLTFCDDPVPLDRWDVRERLETQLSLHSRNKAQIRLWLRRKHRFFPYIRQILSDMNAPEDLLYVPVIESSLLHRAVSAKNAVGPWQFIRSTAKKYGLRVDTSIDERRDLRKATTAALNYLKDLKEEFGSWPAALAAYNIGENRFRKECYRQGTSDYYQMILPDETDRYVFNIIAVKLILEDPSKFGIDPSIEPFHDEKTSQVDIYLPAPVPVSVLAHHAGLSYRSFRKANPWIIGVKLPKGRYTLRVSDTVGDTFTSRLGEYFKLIQKTVRYRHSIRLTVTADTGEMRIAPSREYPVCRKLPKDKQFRVRHRTAKKDRGHYWYRFTLKDGSEAWIWGGQVKR